MLVGLSKAVHKLRWFPAGMPMMALRSNGSTGAEMRRAGEGIICLRLQGIALTERGKDDYNEQRATIH